MVADRRGLLADLATSIADAQGNIDNVSMERPDGDGLIAMSALAMGMQTTAVFSLGVRAVFTTAVTATWAVLMGDMSGWSEASGERRRLGGALTTCPGPVTPGAVVFSIVNVCAAPQSKSRV